MPHGPSPAGGPAGPARPLVPPTPGAATSGLTMRVGLAALLMAAVLAGIGAAIPHTSWTAGPMHGQGTAVGVGLEAVLAVLLFAAERHRRRVPAVGQPAAALRAVLRAILIGALVAIPVLMLINGAGKFRIRPRPPLKLPPPRGRSGHGRIPKLGHWFQADIELVLYGLLALVLLIGIVACVMLLRRAHRRGPSFEDFDEITDDEAQEQLRDAVQSGQAALREVDDARLAIIACYVAMEQSLAGAGAARGDAETPDELLDRAAAAGLVHGGEAARLTALFYEARYSTHPLAGERRDEARRALEVLAASLSRPPEQASAGGPR